MVKKYEYRKRFINEECVAFYILLYHKKICGYLILGKPIIDKVENIALIAKSEHLEWYEGTKKYLNGAKKGFAIPIKKCIIGEEISLDQLRLIGLDFTPPQLYINLEKKPKLLKFLENMYINNKNN